MSSQTLVTRDRRSMRMVWKTLRLRHVGLAFFWACSMLTFRSSILLAGPANTPDFETFVVIASFVANMTTLLAITALMERKPSAFNRLPGWLFCACTIAGIVVLDVAGSLGDGMLMAAVLAGGSLLTGIGYGYFWGSWAEYLGRMHPSRTSFYVPTSFLLTAALFLGISLATENGGVPPLVLMIPLPVLSLVCLSRCQVEMPDGNYARTTNSKRYLTALASLITLIVASLVLSLLFGFVWEMTVLSVGSVNKAHLAPLVANLIVALCLICLVLYAHRRLDLALVFRVIVPAIVILFAVLPFFWETNPVVLNMVMSACYGVFDVIIWYMVTSTAYDFAVSGFVIGGIVRALSILARLVGIGIGYLFMLVPDSPSMLIIGMSVGAVYILSMIGLFYQTRRKGALPSGVSKADEAARAAQDRHNLKHRPAVGEGALPSTATEGQTPRDLENGAIAPASEAGLTAFDEPEGRAALPDGEGPDAQRPGTDASPASAPATPAATDEAIFEMMAEDFSLTRREAELLPYLARGRSARVIADALFVSENTIRTHTRRILEKTDLHSKQQVIDLIEKYR